MCALAMNLRERDIQSLGSPIFNDFLKQIGAVQTTLKEKKQSFYFSALSTCRETLLVKHSSAENGAEGSIQLCVEGGRTHPY